MRENGLASAYSGRAPRGGRGPAQPPSAGNVLARRFDGHPPRTHLAADLTYVRAGGSWCYVCLLVDLCNREIVGSSCGRRKDARLVKAAFSNVDFPLDEVEMFHSDGGSEFCNAEIDALLSAFGIERSVSRPRQPPRQRSGRVDEQGAQARAGAGAPLRLGGASEDRAVRLGELVQQLQAALDAGLHDPGRVQGGGPESLTGSPKKMLPHHLRLRARGSGPSSRTALRAALSAMRMPAALRNVSATRRHPYPNRDFSHIPAMAGLSAARLPEGARLVAAIGGARHPDGLQERGERISASAASLSRASACRREGRRRGGRSS